MFLRKWFLNPKQLILKKIFIIQTQYKLMTLNFRTFGFLKVHHLSKPKTCVRICWRESKAHLSSKWVTEDWHLSQCLPAKKFLTNFKGQETIPKSYMIHQNIILMKNFKILWELANVTQWYKVSKCSWKNYINKLAQYRVAP